MLQNSLMVRIADEATCYHQWVHHPIVPPREGVFLFRKIIRVDDVGGGRLL
jgi:hypothetical protein